MNLESQVCSLEYAKRLKELGVKQDGYFSWYAFENPLQQIYKESDVDEDRWRVGNTRDCSKGGADWVYSAFTASELLDLLPHRITILHEEPFNSFRLRMEKSFMIKGMDNPETLLRTDIYSINYYCDTTSQTLDWLFSSLTNNITDENFANALAKMFIYLIENKLCVTN